MGDQNTVKIVALLVAGISVLGTVIGLLFNHVIKGHKRELATKDEHAKELIGLNKELIGVTRDVKESVNSNSKAMESNTKATDKMVDRIDTLHEDILNAMRK